jgi:hypothetical protein
VEVLYAQLLLLLLDQQVLPIELGIDLFALGDVLMRDDVTAARGLPIRPSASSCTSDLILPNWAISLSTNWSGSEAT